MTDEEFENTWMKLRDMEKTFIDAYLETFSIKEAGKAAKYRYPRPLFAKLFPIIQEKAKRDRINADFFNANNILNEMRKLYETSQSDIVKWNILKELRALYCENPENGAQKLQGEVTIKFD